MRYVSLRRFVLDACDGPFGSAIKTEHYADEGARVIRLGNIGVGEWRDESKAFLAVDYWRQLVGHHARSGDVIVAGLGDEGNSVGRACVVPTRISRALVKADCYRLRIDPSRADPRFLAAFLSSKAGSGQAEALAEGSTRTRLTLSKALSIRVPEIDRATQSLVADYLDAETARIDALITKKRRLAELIRARSQAWIDQFFAHPGRQYALKRLLAQSPCYGVLVPEFAEDGVPFIRVNDISVLNDRAGTLIQISSTQSREYKRTVVQPGDVLLSVVGSIDKVTVVGPEMAGANVARAVARLVPANSVPPELLAQWLTTTQYLDQARLATLSDTAQPTLNMGDLADFEVSFPAPEAREAFLHRSHSELARHRRTEMLLIRQIALIQEHRQALITAAVTGELQIPGRAAS